MWIFFYCGRAFFFKIFKNILLFYSVLKTYEVLSSLIFCFAFIFSHVIVGVTILQHGWEFLKYNLISKQHIRQMNELN